MTELDKAIVDLVRRHRLDQLTAVSKDDLDIQARQFARALTDYADATRRVFEASDLSASDAAAERYHLVATLYASGLIAALAHALLSVAGEQ